MKLVLLKIFKQWQSNPQGIKIFSTSLLGAIGFLLLMSLFAPAESSSPSPNMPAGWQRLSLNVSATLQVHPGDMVAVYHTQGELLLKEALVMAIHAESENWKVEIAAPALSSSQWQRLSQLSLEVLYLTPAITKQIVKNSYARTQYEMVY